MSDIFYVFLPYFWSKSFLTWGTKWLWMRVHPLHLCGWWLLYTPLVQFWGSPPLLRPPGGMSQSGPGPRGPGNVPSTAPIPMVYGPWGDPCHALPVNHSPNFLFPRALCGWDVRPGYIKPIAERTRDNGSHGHIATMLQKEWKIQGTSGTVIHLTYPEYPCTDTRCIHVLISINTPFSPYGWVYIYMHRPQNTS